MKKGSIMWLLFIECVFVALLIGFFIGRNTNHTPIQVSALSDTGAAAITETTVADTSEAAVGKVNINTASAAELESLPSIGPVLAQRIVDYRNQYGPFESLADLTNVSGIGLERVEQIMDYVTVGG